MCEKGITATPWKHFSLKYVWSVNLFFTPSFKNEQNMFDEEISIKPFETICVVAKTPFFAVQKALEAFNKNMDSQKIIIKQKKELKEKNEKKIEK